MFNYNLIIILIFLIIFDISIIIIQRILFLSLKSFKIFNNFMIIILNIIIQLFFKSYVCMIIIFFKSNDILNSHIKSGKTLNFVLFNFIIRFPFQKIIIFFISLLLKLFTSIIYFFIV